MTIKDTEKSIRESTRVNIRESIRENTRESTRESTRETTRVNIKENTKEEERLEEGNLPIRAALKTRPLKSTLKMSLLSPNWVDLEMRKIMIALYVKLLRISH